LIAIDDAVMTKPGTVVRHVVVIMKNDGHRTLAQSTLPINKTSDTRNHRSTKTVKDMARPIAPPKTAAFEAVKIAS
jgi:hypothetical protein